MSYVNLTLISGNLENVVEKFYINAIENDPQPEGVSKSIYLIMLTTEVLEQLGNSQPTQKEIDVMEAMLKRISRRKLIKSHLKQAA